MGFFTYCEKVSGFVGINPVLETIHFVFRCWTRNKTVGECADKIKEMQK